MSRRGTAPPYKSGDYVAVLSEDDSVVSVRKIEKVTARLVILTDPCGKFQTRNGLAATYDASNPHHHIVPATEAHRAEVERDRLLIKLCRVRWADVEILDLRRIVGELPPPESSK